MILRGLGFMFLSTSLLCGGIRTVASAPALADAVKAATPGDTIEIQNGHYEQALTLEGQGQPGKPVRIRAESRGKVVFTRPLAMKGSWITLEGPVFQGQSNVTIQGTGIRLTRATFSNSNSPNWVVVTEGSKQAEVDHCLFENKENNGSLQKGAQTLRIKANNLLERHHIHHNHFRNIRKGASGNGFETIQLITHGNPFNPPGADSETRIEDNLFEHCDGESEIISVKANGNRILRNTFRACKGGLVLRHGHRNLVAGNFFLGDREAGTEGVRLQGRDQVVANNYFQGLDGAAIAMMDGTPDDLYLRVERARILHNTVIDCSEAMAIGLNHSSHPNGSPPTDCLIAGNAFLGRNPKSGLIRYVQGDPPEKWTWRDNHYQGLAGIPTLEGLSATDLNFLVDKSWSLARPTAKTPTRVRTEDSDVLDTDVLGIHRGKNTSVGALEYSDEKHRHEPLRPDKVGPEA